MLLEEAPQNRQTLRALRSSTQSSHQELTNSIVQFFTRWAHGLWKRALLSLS